MRNLQGNKKDQVYKTEGTGLGMAITKYIIDTMGGTVQLNSIPGKGSEFHIILDLEKAFTKKKIWFFHHGMY